MCTSGGAAPRRTPEKTHSRELTRVAPVTVSRESGPGILSLTFTVASSKVGLVSVTVHSVVSPRLKLAGSHVLSNVTGACRRTIVTGSWARPPFLDSSSIVAWRTSPIGTRLASISMSNVSSPPAGRKRCSGTSIFRSRGASTSRLHQLLRPRTLSAVRGTRDLARHRRHVEARVVRERQVGLEGHVVGAGRVEGETRPARGREVDPTGAEVEGAGRRHAVLLDDAARPGASSSART